MNWGGDLQALELPQDRGLHRLGSKLVRREFRHAGSCCGRRGQYMDATTQSLSEKLVDRQRARNMKLTPEKRYTHVRRNLQLQTGLEATRPRSQCDLQLRRESGDWENSSGISPQGHAGKVLPFPQRCQNLLTVRPS